MEGKEPLLQEGRGEIAQGSVHWEAEGERSKSFLPFGLCVS